MVNEGRGLRWAQLAGIALVVGLLSWLGWRLYLNAGHLLGPASWVSAVLLVAMAVLVIGAGLPVRRFLRGEARKTLSPIRAARTLVLAQAAALTGSGVLGWYAAQAAHALARRRPAGLPRPAVAAARALRGVAGAHDRRDAHPADVPRRPARGDRRSGAQD